MIFMVLWDCNECRPTSTGCGRVRNLISGSCIVIVLPEIAVTSQAATRHRPTRRPSQPVLIKMVNIPKYVGICLLQGRNTDEMLLVGPAEHVSLDLDLGMAARGI